MATAFRATSTGYRADLQKHERRLLSTLCGDVAEILTRRDQEVAGPSDQNAEGSGESSSLFAHFSAELAGLDSEQPLSRPEDPAAQRLLPDASEDPEESDQLRRLTEPSLRQSQLADLRTARMLLESSPLAVPEAAAAGFGRALNAVRLTLATRLRIETDDDAARIHQRARSPHGADRESGSEAFMAEVYTFVTWLQETLFEAMLENLPDEAADAADPADPSDHGDPAASEDHQEDPHQ